MTITNAQSAILEDGEAVRAEGPSRPEGWWTYTATSQFPQMPARA